ncbi:TonB-dependent receptor [Prevotella copri]|uniref:SusC/RagA family TonB-linked outer membrane protein n=1 Tax=Segatella copri TaxID=165179 RepID=UPI00129150EB|nr:TonB-dependent receptor [Segatella copri]MQP00557.1 TonB-dependent receptor [Segatella copri]
MRQTQKNSGFVHSQAYVKAIACLVLACGGGALPTLAANETLSNPKVENVQQNEVTVKGVVKDANGEAIIGASVIEKGNAKNGTVTDLDGNYTLKVKRGATLTISYIGYISQETKGGNIILEEDLKSLNEVVVIGYGTQKKADVTSAVVSVKAEDFTKGNFNDAGDLIKGKVAGLTITRPSGDPGATTQISLRGIATVSGNAQPLVLVDGVPGSLSSVPPENIASIDVLKDASAAAIYGTRGAGGVIIITTKTGQREQRTEVTYNGYVSFSTWAKKADFMTSSDIRAGKTTFNDEGYDTDWLDAISRVGVTQNHSISLSGGNAKTSYFGNFTYRKAEGVMKKTGNESMSVAFDMSHWMLNDMLKLNIKVNADQYQYDVNDATTIYRQAVIRNPTSPIWNEDGSYNEGSLLQYWNPVSLQKEQSGKNKSQTVKMTGNLTFEPIKGWQTNLMLSKDQTINRGGYYYTSNHSLQGVNQKGSYSGSASQSGYTSEATYLELTSKFMKNFNNVHRLDALAGYSYSEDVYDDASMWNANFPTDYFSYYNMGLGSKLTDGQASMSSSKNSSKLIGFFGRVSYGYADRYNILASLRYEGSSKFGDNHKWGAFPSVSLGWNIMNESFMKSTKSWLNNLKLRAGWGITGVIPGSSYLSLLRYSYNGGNYYRNGKWNKGLKAASNPNPDLKWETAREFNVGIDWSVFNDRLSGSFDYYNKKTSDMLYDYTVPSPPNLYTTTTANVGEMRNTGFELMIKGVPVQTKNWRWETQATLQHNSNKLLSLSNELYQTDNTQWLQGVGDPVTQYTHRVAVGESLGQIWSLKAVGVSDQGLFLIENPKTGQCAEFYQEMRNDYDNWYEYMGSGIPKFTLGWNNTINYKDFDLSLQCNGQFGYKIINQQRVFYENNAHAYNKLKSAADAIGGNRPLSGAQSQVVTSYYIEHGDYFKLSSLTLGYTYTPKKKTYIQNARLYGSVYNVFTITKYKGTDPELGSDNFWTAGVDDRDKYPTVRSFTIGLNVTF